MLSTLVCVAGGLAPVARFPTVARVTACASIRALSVAVLDIPLFEPFGISGGAQVAANNVFVTLEFADGTRGCGEAAPLSAYNGETQAGTLTTLTAARSWLAGRATSLENGRALAAEFRAHGGAACGSAQCAFELALLDALAKQRGVPLGKFFGGAGTALETDMTVTTGSAAQAAENPSRSDPLKMQFPSSQRRPDRREQLHQLRLRIQHRCDAAGEFDRYAFRRAGLREQRVNGSGELLPVSRTWDGGTFTALTPSSGSEAGTIDRSSGPTFAAREC